LMWLRFVWLRFVWLRFVWLRFVWLRFVWLRFVWLWSVWLWSMQTSLISSPPWCSSREHSRRGWQPPSIQLVAVSDRRKVARPSARQTVDDVNPGATLCK